MFSAQMDYIICMYYKISQMPFEIGRDWFFCVADIKPDV